LQVISTVMKAQTPSPELDPAALRSRGDMGILVILASVAALLVFLRACV